MMTSFFNHTSFLFLAVIGLISVTYHYALPSNWRDLSHDDLFTFSPKLPLVINGSLDAVKRFQCSEGWKRLGGSCYYLTNVTSTSATANDTCTLLYSNHSQLMRIRNRIELSYAAYELIKNNLPELLLEIDPSLVTERKTMNTISSNEQMKWQREEEKFRRARLNYYRLKEIFDGESSEEDLQPNNVIDSNKYNSKNNIANSHGYANIVVGVSGISSICNQVVWDIRKNNSHVFILTTYRNINDTVCSLSDIDPNESYKYICQDVLDYCYGNFACGKHGYCESGPTGFKCSCRFLYDGVLCEKGSNHDIQILIGVAIIIVFLILSIAKVRVFLCPVCPRFLGSCCKTPLVRSNNSENRKNESQSKIIEHELIRWYFVCGLAVIFFLLSIAPVSYQLEFDSPINVNSSVITQCQQTSLFQLDNLVLFSMAIILVIFFVVNKVGTKEDNVCSVRFDRLLPFKPFCVANRYETAAVFGILTFEILKVCDEFFLAINESSNRGVLLTLFERIFMVLILGLRYYPLLVSLQVRNFHVRFFTFVYTVSIIAFMIKYVISCENYLPISKRLSTLSESTLDIKPDIWITMYGLVINIVYLGLVSYIGAELTVRFVYDSFNIPHKKNQSIWNITEIQSDECEYSINHKLNSSQVRPTLNFENVQRSCIRKIVDSIYRWDNYFRYTTIALCTYIVAFILLLYLPATFIVFYTSHMTKSISFLRFFFQSTVKKNLEKWSFKREIIFSAIATMIGQGIQLLFVIKNYKKHKKELYNGKCDDIPSYERLGEKTIVAKSGLYPGYFIQYIVGSLVISFHLVLFIIIISRIVRAQVGLLNTIFIFLLPVIILYAFQKLIGRWADIINSSHHSENEESSINMAIYTNTMYFTFIPNFFTGTASCFIRLIEGFVIHVIFMIRIDCSYIGRPLETWDPGFTSYACYLHMETTCLNNMSHDCWLNIDKLLSPAVLKKVEQTTTDDDAACLEETYTEPHIQHPSDNIITDGSIKKSIQYSTVAETEKDSVSNRIKCSGYNSINYETYEDPAPITNRKNKPNVESKSRLHQHYRKDNKDYDSQLQCEPLTAMENS